MVTTGRAHCLFTKATRVLIVTAKGYLNLTNPCYDRVTCSWYLHDCVTINRCLSSVSGDRATAGQCSREGEMCAGFRSNTIFIAQGEMFAV